MCIRDRYTIAGYLQTVFQDTYDNILMSMSPYAAKQCGLISEQKNNINDLYRNLSLTDQKVKSPGVNELGRFERKYLYLIIAPPCIVVR